MKKFSVLVILGVFLVGSIFAVDLSITGRVQSKLEIALSGNFDFDINGDGTEIVDTGVNLSLISNHRAYTISVSSANNGVLENAGATDTIPYLMKITTTGFAGTQTSNAFSAFAAVTTAAKNIVYSNGKTPRAGVDFPIEIKVESYTDFFENVSALEADTVYTDTVTFAIAAN